MSKASIKYEAPLKKLPIESFVDLEVGSSEKSFSKKAVKYLKQIESLKIDSFGLDNFSDPDDFKINNWMPFLLKITSRQLFWCRFQGFSFNAKQLKLLLLSCNKVQEVRFCDWSLSEFTITENPLHPPYKHSYKTSTLEITNCISSSGSLLTLKSPEFLSILSILKVPSYSSCLTKVYLTLSIKKIDWHTFLEMVRELPNKAIQFELVNYATNHYEGTVAMYGVNFKDGVTVRWEETEDEGE